MMLIIIVNCGGLVNAFEGRWMKKHFLFRESCYIIGKGWTGTLGYLPILKK